MLLQPWAHLVAVGAKQLETRTWQTTYRGPLAIGASRSYDRAGASDLRRRSFQFPPRCELAYGAVIATAVLREIMPYTAALVPQGLFPFTPGERRFAWMLEDVKMLEQPVPVKGRLGLFEVAL